MKYFPDEPATGAWARYAVPVPRRGHAMDGLANIPASWCDAREFDAETSNGLLESHPDHCLVEGIQIYTVGIPCEKIRRAAQKCPECNSVWRPGEGSCFYVFIVESMACLNFLGRR